MSETCVTMVCETSKKPATTTKYKAATTTTLTQDRSTIHSTHGTTKTNRAKLHSSV
jgi:hypothetical protein